MPTFDWFDATGWPEIGHVPTNADTTIIPSGRTIALSRPGAAIGKLTVQAGGALMLTPGAALDVHTNLIVDGLLAADAAVGGAVSVPFHTTRAMVGGALAPLATDTRLWVTEHAV